MADRVRVPTREAAGPEPGRHRGRLQPLQFVDHKRGGSDPPDIVWRFACADGSIVQRRTWGYATQFNHTGRFIMGMMGLKALPAGRSLDVTDLVGEEYELSVELVEGETRSFTRVASATRVHHPDHRPKGPAVGAPRPRPKAGPDELEVWHIVGEIGTPAKAAVADLRAKVRSGEVAANRLAVNVPGELEDGGKEPLWLDWEAFEARLERQGRREKAVAAVEGGAA